MDDHPSAETPGRPAVEHEPAERQLPSVGKQGLLFSEEPKSEIVQLPDSWFTLARRSGRLWPARREPSQAADLIRP